MKHANCYAEHVALFVAEAHRQLALGETWRASGSYADALLSLLLWLNVGCANDCPARPRR